MNFEKAIYFDMDGTLADLYGVPNWLPKLRACDPSPYAQAVPMCDLRLMARYLNQLQRKGYTLGVISWLSKEASPIYDEAVRLRKKRWQQARAKRLPLICGKSSLPILSGRH